jgi:ribosomal protein S18 acetylase RimI-like enzyme
VANLVRAANGEVELQPVSDMDAYYRRFDPLELRDDCAIVEVGGRVIAYVRASWGRLSTGESGTEGIANIDPAAEEPELGRLLVRHVLDRAIAHRAAGRSGYVRSYAGDRNVRLRAELEAAGFRVIRAGAEMVRPTLDDIPDLPLPDGFEIRPIARDDGAMIRRVWDASNRAFADSYAHDLPTEATFEGWLTAATFDPALWRVAFHGDVIAGQILNYLGEPAPHGSRIGFTEAISVQPEFRRRGLARALLAESLRAVRDAGATRAALGVDSHNPNQAQALYASMGYRVISTSYVYELAEGDLARPASEGQP